MSTRHRHLVACTAVLAVAAAGAATASADRAATPAQKTQIAKAVKASPVAGLRSVRNRFRVTRARVSTVSRAWATARIVAKPRFRNTFQAGYVVLVRPPAGRWVVVDAGSATVGCGVAPYKVLKDLDIGGCPPDERL